MLSRFLSIFSIGLIIGLVLTIGVSKLIINKDLPAATESAQSVDQPKEVTEEKPKKQQDGEAARPIADEALILAQKSCMSCHAVSKYGSGGGEQGPDLTSPMMGSYIQEKYGITLREYLDKPQSSVMAPILEKLKLTNEEKDQIAKLLTEK